MFRKKREAKRQEMISIVNNILPINASLILFEFKPRFFDEDFSIIIEHNGNKHLFDIVKEDIYHNGKLHCDSSYHYFEKASTFSKLLDVIRDILNSVHLFRAPLSRRIGANKEKEKLCFPQRSKKSSEL